MAEADEWFVSESLLEVSEAPVKALKVKDGSMRLWI